MRHRESEAGLAHPAGTDEGDQPDVIAGREGQHLASMSAARPRMGVDGAGGRPWLVRFSG